MNRIPEQQINTGNHQQGVPGCCQKDGVEMLPVLLIIAIIFHHAIVLRKFPYIAFCKILKAQIKKCSYTPTEVL